MDNLRLPKTLLSVTDDVLYKLGPKGEFLATFPLETIDDVRVERSYDIAFPAMMIGVFGALGAVGYYYIPYTGLGLTAAIVCGGICWFSVWAMFGRKIVVETKDGKVGYVVADTYEEADGFVVSLRHQLRNRN